MRSNENVIEWLNGDKQVSCTISQGKFITKIMKLIEKYPNEVEITNNDDGTIYCKMPISWLKINHREVSEEQKQKSRERLSQYRKTKESDSNEKTN